MHFLFAVLFLVATPDSLEAWPQPSELTRVNLEWQTHAEGFESVMTIEVPPLPVVQKSNPPRGMGSDVEQWRGLVEAHFGDLGPDAVEMALRVMACESNGNPTARNPRSSATGLMQIMASVWGPEFGYSQSDFEIPELNMWTARQVYDRQGWNAWTCWRR